MSRINRLTFTNTMGAGFRKANCVEPNFTFDNQNLALMIHSMLTMRLQSMSVHYIFFHYIIHLSFFLKLDTVCPFSPDLPVKGQLTSYIESLVSDATQKALSLSYGHLLAV